MPGDAHPGGAGELQRLTQAGLDRFALFVADWQPSDVRMLTALLDKLKNSIAAVAAQEDQQRPAGRAGRAHPGRISRTGSRQERRYPGAPPAPQNRRPAAAPTAIRTGRDRRQNGGDTRVVDVEAESLT